MQASDWVNVSQHWAIAVVLISFFWFGFKCLCEYYDSQKD